MGGRLRTILTSAESEDTGVSVAGHDHLTEVVEPAFLAAFVVNRFPIRVVCHGYRGEVSIDGVEKKVHLREISVLMHVKECFFNFFDDGGVEAFSDDQRHVRVFLAADQGFYRSRVFLVFVEKEFEVDFKRDKPLCFAGDRVFELVFSASE